MVRDLLKNQALWAVAVPAFCLAYLFFGLLGMRDAQRLALQRVDKANEATKYAQQIIALQQESGQIGEGGQERYFKGIESARDCAQKAIIPEGKLSRGEGANPQVLQGDTTRYRENYRLDGVSLVKLCQFVDHAELNFSDLNCTNIDLTRERGKDKDYWNATLTLQYLVR